MKETTSVESHSTVTHSNNTTKTSVSNEVPSTPRRTRTRSIDESDSLLKTPPSNPFFNQAGLNISPNPQYTTSHLSNVPSTPSNNINSSPSLKSPSNSKSPFRHGDDDDDDDDSEKPPIRDLSNALKTRLSYAFLKYQKGWENQSLDEIENNMDGSLNNNDNFTPRLLKKSTASKVTKPGLNGNFTVKSPKKVSQSDNFSNGGAVLSSNANQAFLQMLKKSPKRPAKITIPTNPASRRDSNQNINEEDAVKTLMALSSPVRSRDGSIRRSVRKSVSHEQFGEELRKDDSTEVEDNDDTTEDDDAD